MLIIFDEPVHWDMSVLSIWANCDEARILCRAGRETIAELPGYTHVTSPEIARWRTEIAGLLKPSFEFKIRTGAFDPGPSKSVTVGREEIIKGVRPSSAYYVAWKRDGQTQRFAHHHTDLNSALDFACEAFKIECSDVWITDDNGQRVADRVEIAKYADRTGKPYS
jgi:hypothetical protein